jgi:hypothetical protein
MFSDSELEVLKQVASRFKNTPTEEIETDAHNEAPWSETKYKQAIPYTLAAHDKDARVSEAEIELALSIL